MTNRGQVILTSTNTSSPASPRALRWFRHRLPPSARVPGRVPPRPVGGDRPCARARRPAVVSDTDHVVLEASGVGYQVQCHLRTLAALHEMGDREVTLHVHTSVTDDAIRLYGFLGRDQHSASSGCSIGVERIGPKAALSILGRAELQAMVRAIRDGDVALLATVPGIGRRTAERVILELRDRLAEIALSLEPAAPTAAAQAIEAAVAGLVGLGFRESEARPAVRAALGKVLLVNDSKATNADSAAQALACFSDIFWIAGGKSKTGGIESLRNFFPRIRKAYLVGEAAKEFAATAADATGAGAGVTAAAAVCHGAVAASARLERLLISPRYENRDGRAWPGQLRCSGHRRRNARV